MLFQGQTDVTDSKHHAMIWDIITWRGLLRAFPFLFGKKNHSFPSHLSNLVWSRWLDIDLYGSRGLKRSKLKSADNSEISC